MSADECIVHKAVKMLYKTRDVYWILKKSSTLGVFLRIINLDTLKLV